MARLALIFTLAGKDWRLFWADGRAAVLCFLVPIILASAFGMIFDRPSRPDAQVKLPLLVAVEGDSPFLRALLDDVAASPRMEVEVVSVAEIEGRLQDRRPGVAVVVPADIDDLTTRPRLRIYHHPLSSMEAQWAEGVMTELILKRLAAEKLGPMVGALATQPPFETHAVAVAGPQAKFNAYSHSFCGMTLQYLLFWGMESGLLLLRERQRGVWLRVRTAPVPFSAVLLGKALATAAIALLQVLVTFGFGYVAFGVTVGSFGAFLLVAFLVSSLSAALGLLVAAVGGTETRARSVSILAILGISMLGGLWLPTFLLPGWLRDVALSLPTTWAMRALDATTWQGRDFLATLPSLAAVAGFTLLFLLVAFRCFFANERRSRGGATA
jgi:ABC-2 type transport system permease protein